MSNPFLNRTSAPSGPARDILPVTPSDTVDLSSVAIAIYVETGGALQFVTERGTTRTVNLADHAILPVATARVLASGTTATGIHAFVV